MYIEPAKFWMALAPSLEKYLGSDTDRFRVICSGVSGYEEHVATPTAPASSPIIQTFTAGLNFLPRCPTESPFHGESGYPRSE